MVCSAQHMEKAQALRRLLAAYTASEDLIRVGAYQKGSDPMLDRALVILPELNRFLQQSANEQTSLEDNINRLLALAS
jgi:flagellum-specific ATP synthase